MKPPELADRKQKLVASNRRARHDYSIVQTIEAGVVLQGTEVKSLRGGKCSMQDSYAAFVDKNSLELIVYNIHIDEYDFGNRENHKPKRERKLLVNYRESKKLKTQVMEKGITLIPLSVYFSGPFVKIELGLAKAKKMYDKRESTKERETKRDIQRKFKL